MAAVETLKASGIADDDEEWLYGDSGPAPNREPAAPGTAVPDGVPPPKDKEEGEMSGDERSQSQEKFDDDDDDDSDDDDDVQVTIGDIKAFPVSGAGTNLFKGSGTYQKQPVGQVGQKISTTTPGVKGVDIDGEGVINGVNVYEFSLDSLRDEEKPWRKPGADITDYFNYGFNEDSWRKYCQKQNRLRSDNGVPIPRAFATLGMGSITHSHMPRHEQQDVAPPGTTFPLNNVKVLTKPPPQQMSGTIAVLGSTAASRRPAEEQNNDIQQIGTLGSDPNKAPTGVPPPGMPPMGMPPPDYSMPPPGMPPMPGFNPAGPPPGMVPPPNMFNPPPQVPPFFQPHVGPPPPGSGGFGERPPFSYAGPQPIQPTYTEHQPKPAWDARDSYSREARDRERERERDKDSYYKRERSPGGGSGYSSGENSEDFRYSRTREYSSSRDYESRDYYRGSRDRDSERSRSERDRSRSRERESRRHRDRDRGDRDDKKSKRKIKDEPDDSDYYKSSSSKHKKSKRSKREKEDEGGSGNPDDTAGT